MLLYLSENFCHCQSPPKLFQCLPFFMKCRGLVLLCSCWHLCAAFTQVRIHCNFLHQLEFGAVAQLYPEVGVKFGIRFGEGKMMLPIAPVWYLHIKSTLE